MYYHVFFTEKLLCCAFEEKDEEIVKLKSSMTVVQRRVMVLEEKIEHNDSYKWRNTLIFFGMSVPIKLNPESGTEIIFNLLKNFLNMEINPLEISVCHRLAHNKNGSRIFRRKTVRCKKKKPNWT